MQIQPDIQNEFGTLKTVVVGVARDMGGIPAWEDCYDPRSAESVLNNTYPKEESCRDEMKGFIEILEELNVEVLRPESIPALNQVFARDVAFVIEDQFVLPNVIEDRAKEVTAMALIEGNIPSSNIIRMPSGCYAEGGDVIVHNHYVFIGVSNEEAFQTHKTSRTNYPGLNYLSDEFPGKMFKGFELLKSDVDPRKGSLHLDCAFQPVGCGALLAPHLFKNQDDVDWIKSFFGTENVYECSEEEAYALTTNVFSVSPTQVIVADTFISLVDWLTLKGMEVFKVPYSEIVKMGGLLRCSTMPLKRD